MVATIHIRRHTQLPLLGWLFCVTHHVEEMTHCVFAPCWETALHLWMTQDMYCCIELDGPFDTVYSRTCVKQPLLHHWHIRAENCQTSSVLLLDYSKAFGLVDYNIIIAKLAAYGVPDILLR